MPRRPNRRQPFAGLVSSACARPARPRTCNELAPAAPADVVAEHCRAAPRMPKLQDKRRLPAASFPPPTEGHQGRNTMQFRTLALVCSTAVAALPASVAIAQDKVSDGVVRIGLIEDMSGVY